MTRSVILFAKPPMMGLAKTRLAHGMGKAEAQRVARLTLARTLRAATDPRWQLTLYTTPRRHLAATLGGLWPPSLARQDQAGGDLGERLTRAFDRAPHGPVLFIGADCPGLTRGLVWRAFKALQRQDTVVGPANDGGFWLYGLTKGGRAFRPPFAPVRWSSEHALADVLANRDSQAPPARLPTLIDIDTAEDWRAWSRLYSS
ncbi:MAG: TIGR04282 family arsenosugar biosynthesis glycosyltransferase [Pseudomonadota bacterium]